MRNFCGTIGIPTSNPEESCNGKKRPLIHPPIAAGNKPEAK